MIRKTMMKNTKLFKPADLPNSEGFRFLGLNSEGKRYRCEVVKGSDGCHRIEGMPFKDLVAWTNNLEDLK